jgi:hypothetical protein
VSDVVRRLMSPSRRVSLQDLAATWFTAYIVARVPGCAALAHDMTLLRRIRGGLGRVLMESASAEALAGRPCPWDPPCALDILFREQVRIGPQGVPKPYVLGTDRKGPDLLVTMRLFGFAADWSAAATHALVVTLSRRIDWPGQRGDLFLPRASVQQVSVRSAEGLTGVSTGQGRPVELEFLTPMNAEGSDPLEQPETILARLARRARGLALWHDADLDENWPQLAEAWRAASYDLRLLRHARVGRHSGRTHRDFDMDAVTGTVLMDDVVPEVWPLLVIGQETHVGKGASEGFGRYRLG